MIAFSRYWRKIYKFCPLLAGANVHYTLENYEEAIGDTQRAIDLDPAFAKVSQPVALSH